MLGAGILVPGVVDALLFLVQLPGPAGVEVSVAAQGAELEDGFDVGPSRQCLVPQADGFAGRAERDDRCLGCPR